MKFAGTTILKTTSLALVLLGISSLSFFVPFYFGHNQLVIGTLVNAGLFLSSFAKEKSIRASVIFLPSVATVMHGALFSQSTMFLLYFLPCIWLSNFLLIKLFEIFKSYVGFLPSVFIGALGKSTVLFFCASILVRFAIVPNLFLSSMGIWQGITALSGGFLAYIVLQIFYEYAK